MLEFVLEEMFKQKFIVTIATATAAAILVLSPIGIMQNTGFIFIQLRPFLQVRMEIFWL
jgi:hypothetical protein